MPDVIVSESDEFDCKHCGKSFDVENPWDSVSGPPIQCPHCGASHNVLNDSVQMGDDECMVYYVELVKEKT